MTETDPKPKMMSVLVLLSTGKLGAGVVDAFANAAAASKEEERSYKIYGTSRNGNHPKLLGKGVTPIAFTYGDKQSIDNALMVSQPHTVVLITHSITSKSNEVEHGKIILNSCHEHSIPHVILASSDLADVAPKKASHLSSKKILEDYLKGLGLKSWSVLRASSFMENFDDATVMNPLCRGSLKDLYEGWVKVNHVATLDVGKAAVAMAKLPSKWSGKVLTCIASRDTGEDLAVVLSEVSGIPCTYQASPPRLILKYVLSNLYHMVALCRSTSETADWSQEMTEFKEVVPDAMDFRKWLNTQQWSDGTLFGDPAPARSSFVEQYSGPAAVIALAVGAVAIFAAKR